VSTYANLDLRFELNSVDLSDWATSVSWPIEFEELEDTAFGDTGRSRLAGLEDNTLTVNFNQDFAASAVDATISAVLGTVVVCKGRPTSGSISATNPELVTSFLISKYDPFSSDVGSLAKTSVTWPMSDSNGHSRNTS
jgi:hypothetical protein